MVGLPTVRVERRVSDKKGGFDTLQSGLRVDNAKPSIPPTLGARSVLNTERLEKDHKCIRNTSTHTRSFNMVTPKDFKLCIAWKQSSFSVN